MVFSQPSNFRTLQVKADRVQVHPIKEADRPLLDRYRMSMEHDLVLVCVEPPFTVAMLAYAPNDGVAVQFAPTEAFDQTPGTRAGKILNTQSTKAGP